MTTQCIQELKPLRIARYNEYLLFSFFNGWDSAVMNKKTFKEALSGLPEDVLQEIETVLCQSYSPKSYDSRIKSLIRKTLVALVQFNKDNENILMPWLLNSESRGRGNKGFQTVETLIQALGKSQKSTFNQILQPLKLRVQEIIEDSQAFQNVLNDETQDDQFFIKVWNQLFYQSTGWHDLFYHLHNRFLKHPKHLLVQVEEDIDKEMLLKKLNGLPESTLQQMQLKLFDEISEHEPQMVQEFKKILLHLYNFSQNHENVLSSWFEVNGSKQTFKKLIVGLSLKERTDLLAPTQELFMQVKTFVETSGSFKKFVNISAKQSNSNKKQLVLNDSANDYEDQQQEYILKVWEYIFNRSPDWDNAFEHLKRGFLLNPKVLRFKDVNPLVDKRAEALLEVYQAQSNQPFFEKVAEEYKQKHPEKINPQRELFEVKIDRITIPNEYQGHFKKYCIKALRSLVQTVSIEQDSESSSSEQKKVSLIARQISEHYDSNQLEKTFEEIEEELALYLKHLRHYLISEPYQQYLSQRNVLPSRTHFYYLHQVLGVKYSDYKSWMKRGLAFALKEHESMIKEIFVKYLTIESSRGDIHSNLSSDQAHQFKSLQIEHCYSQLVKGFEIFVQQLEVLHKVVHQPSETFAMSELLKDCLRVFVQEESFSDRHAHTSAIEQLRLLDERFFTNVKNRLKYAFSQQNIDWDALYIDDLVTILCDEFLYNQVKRLNLDARGPVVDEVYKMWKVSYKKKNTSNMAGITYTYIQLIVPALYQEAYEQLQYHQPELIQMNITHEAIKRNIYPRILKIIEDKLDSPDLKGLEPIGQYLMNRLGVISQTALNDYWKRLSVNLYQHLDKSFGKVLRRLYPGIKLIDKHVSMITDLIYQLEYRSIIDEFYFDIITQHPIYLSISSSSHATQKQSLDDLWLKINEGLRQPRRLKRLLSTLEMYDVCAQLSSKQPIPFSGDYLEELVNQSASQLNMSVEELKRTDWRQKLETVKQLDSKLITLWEKRQEKAMQALSKISLLKAFIPIESLRPEVRVRSSIRQQYHAHYMSSLESSIFPLYLESKQQEPNFSFQALAQSSTNALLTMGTTESTFDKQKAYKWRLKANWDFYNELILSVPKFRDFMLNQYLSERVPIQVDQELPTHLNMTYQWLQLPKSQEGFFQLQSLEGSHP